MMSSARFMNMARSWRVTRAKAVDCASSPIRDLHVAANHGTSPLEAQNRPAQATYPLQFAGLVGTACLTLAMVACGGNRSDSAQLPDDGLESLPGSPSIRATRIFPASGTDSTWCIFREWPSERLHVFSACDSQTPVAQRFDRAKEGELLFLGATAAGSQLDLLVYDARRNIPSGRVPGVTHDGVDVLRMDSGRSTVPPLVLATEVHLGGLDNAIAVGAGPGGLTACGTSSCFTFSDTSPPLRWSSAGLSGYEIVEAAVHAQGVEAIVRKSYNTLNGAPEAGAFHFGWARLRPEGASVERIPKDCIPYAIKPTVAGATWKCATDAAGVAQLLAFDLARMPATGMMEFGASNSEGRIAWGQTYYLEGLLELAGGRLPQLAAAADWSALRNRLLHEVDLLTKRIDLEPTYFASKRYAVARSNLVIALHLGRVANVLSLAQRTGMLRGEGPEALRRIGQRMWSLEGTLEQMALVRWRDSEYQALIFSPGSDFWCDGANVPYNFTSGYVSGLLAARPLDQQVLGRARALVQPILSRESLETARTWHYWWGDGYDGWASTAGLSIHSPSFSGSRGNSDISYRSIDALALLRLHGQDANAVPALVVSNLQQQVADGGLLPWVNAELVKIGRPVSISPLAAYRHARSAGPWELLAQVWALEALAGTPLGR
jgi:hypothetical protein